MTPVERTMHAKLLADNPVFQEAMEYARQSIVKQLAKSKSTDIQTHQAGAIGLQLMDEIESHIQRLINDEKVRAIKLKQSKYF